MRSVRAGILLTVLVAAHVASESILDDVISIADGIAPVLQNCSNFKVDYSKTIYTLYTRENRQNGLNLTWNNLEAVNATNRVIFIIHGWLQNGKSPWILAMKDAYLSKQPANIIVLDWSLYAGLYYPTSLCAVPLIGTHTGQLIRNLTVTPGVPLDDVTINGFSLGGQVAGYAGQELGGQLGQINGLDIAGPGYLGTAPSKRLDKTDAKFVQGFHTNDLQFGYVGIYGDVDFKFSYAMTCGAMQPGCPANPNIPNSNQTGLAALLPIYFCNHIRAAVYFIESIKSDNFLGVSCQSCRRFNNGLCKDNPTTVAGENCPKDASGVKYLTTNCKAPFAKGASGTAGSLSVTCPVTV